MGRDYEEEEIPTAYASLLLTMWAEIIEIREEFRQCFLNDDLDTSVSHEYAAKLTSMWGELRPKVEGRKDFEKLEEKFLEFEPHYFNPSLLLEGKKTATAKGDDKHLIFGLDKVIRQVIEKLGITG